ncbi:MAG: matrixin family metalloprotease [Rhodocyclaceae bacterium]|nr:matrixin family metalloprotease [Rhodocyclaceae bacterium]
MTRLHGLASLGLVATSLSAQAITIEFDYSFDDGATRLSSAQRNVLDYVAAEFGSRLTDTLDSETYGLLNFFDPAGPGGAGIQLTNQTIAADTLRVYVGASQLGGSTVGLGGPGGGSIRSRGETGVGSTDFAPWGGAISFDVDTNWYVDNDPTTREAFSGFDFYSVATHELGHVLGFGTAGSWFSQVSGSGFVGDAAVATYSAEQGSPQGSVPLAGGLSHWSNGLTSFVGGVRQEVALDGTIGFGVRKDFTDLDWAALADIGWEVSPVSAVPENDAYALMLAGLGLLAMVSRRRSAQGR